MPYGTTVWVVCPIVIEPVENLWVLCGPRVVGVVADDVVKLAREEGPNMGDRWALLEIGPTSKIERVVAFGADGLQMRKEVCPQDVKCNAMTSKMIMDAADYAVSQVRFVPCLQN